MSAPSSATRMLRQIARRAVFPRLVPSSARWCSNSSHQFSPLAIYSSFPATLFRVQGSSKSRLFGETKPDPAAGGSLADAVRIADDGLVYPFATDQAKNGACVMPNTFFMQELSRMEMDWYYDETEKGKDMERPLIFRILKGTPVPEPLVLLHLYAATFSLQPSRGIPLDELNKALDKFYVDHAEKELLEDWLAKHEYGEAHIDSEHEWMHE